MRIAAAVLFWLAGLAGAPPALAASSGDLLEPDKAFVFSARAVDPQTVEVVYRIASGYYLYRPKFQFSADSAAVTLGVPQFPQGDVHEDKFLGKVETYRKQVRIQVPVEAAAGVQAFRLKAVSQGCADIGVCYVPYEHSAQILLAGTSRASTSGGLLSRLGVANAEEALDTPLAQQIVSDEARFVDILESGRLLSVLAFFFIAGIALTFTPCVLPMVPILSGIIVGEGRQANRRRALLLSLCYVLGMSLTYTAIGVAAALSGQLLSAALQNAWVLWAFALIFVLLALSTFGFYDLRLPSVLHAHLAAANRRLPGGHYGGVVIMGALSALIVSPCIAAPLAGALLYISQSRDVWLGGSALLATALGMGVPLVLVGVSEGAFLPKTGAWTKAVKQVFGVLLLGVSIWIVSPVIPAAAQMLAWAALLIVSAMFLRAIDPLPHDASGWSRLWKGAGMIALVAGAALVIGALAGSKDPLQPLAGLGAGSVAQAQSVRFERIKTVSELDNRLASAGRPVMLDFYADWCVTCKEMERFTFGDERVQARLSDMLALRVDVTANSSEDKALLKRFRLFGPPGIVFFDRDGREIEGLRVIGYQNADRFLRTLDAAADPRRSADQVPLRRFAASSAK